MSLAPFILSLGVSIFGGGADRATPTRDQIDSIESKMRLPVEAPAPLSQYQRYYAWTVDNGRKYILGVYVYDGLMARVGTAGGERIHLVLETEIPTVKNGGCGVITFYVDPRAGRTPSLLCNAEGPAALSKN